MRSKWMSVFGVMLLVAALWGCGSNGGSGGSAVPPAGGATPAGEVGSSTCTVCHFAVVAQGWTGSIHEVAGDDVAGCEGCHGGGQFHVAAPVNVAVPFPSPTLASQCSQCHTSAAMLTRHAGDNPATATTSAGTTIEGYVFRAAEPQGCRDCHGNLPHGNPVDIAYNEQWANSAHGGHIATGPVTDATAPAWTHYDWDSSFKADGSDADSFPDKDRVDCQRCHTATGISNFLNNPTAYDPAKNDFSHLAGWSGTTSGTISDASTWGVTTSSGQNELLFCWGCHSDVATGALRNPGAITESYTAVNQPVSSSNAVADTGTAVTVNYQDIGNSNVCMSCHLGREVGANITAVTSSDGILSFINSHYLTAGATIFSESGYEYAATTYPDGFHREIGVLNTANTGTAGPCVTCHMSGAESHSFEVVAKDAGGNITAITSTVCGNCHGAMTPAVLEAKKEEFHQAMEALRLALEARGIFFGEAHPYFFTAPFVPGGTNTGLTNWQAVATAIGAGVDWRNVMGAAFNYNLFEHDPGAYAHNRTYALMLIRDSIDFLGDGLVDGDSSIVRTMVRAGFDMGTVNSSGNPLHTAAIAAASASPATGAATCSACHKAPAHYGGNATSTGSTPAQWVAPYANVYPACSTCHAGGNVGANTTLLDQYATSNHGDVNGAWNHVTTAIPAPTTIAAVDYRTFCHRCHTTQGYIDQAAFNVSNLPGDGSYPVWPSIAGQTMLDAVACDACHTDVGTGATRVFAAPYTASYYSAATAFNTAANFVYPPSGPSSICIRCHSGRDSAGIGQLIKDSVAPAAAATVLRTHYLGSALTLFNAGGYHFGVTDYSVFGSHKFNGGAGEGPCVNCHMNRTAGPDHTFWPIEEDETTGTITAVLSSACAECHITQPMTAAYLTEVRNDFKTVKDALEAALEAKGIFYRNEQEAAGSTGRFYTSGAHTTELQYSATTPSYLSLAGGAGNEAFAKDLMGAAFNLGFMDYIQEPGAYAHNWEYARRLLTDSIDVLDDGLVNGTNIPAPVAAINAKYPSL